jgi:hypothetical protein
MKRQVDLRKILEQWPYEPENNVRFARGSDGREILQVRLPLGLEQYELEGRPDGQKPEGAESWLDHHLARLAQAKLDKGDAAFALTPEECAELFAEGMLYYYRYLHLFQAQDWPRTMRDTARNLKLFDFVNDYAQRPEDQQYLEQWRPYILRINAVAAAMIELGNHHHALALDHLTAAINRIVALPDLEEETFKFERERSVGALRELAAQVEKSQPISKLELLERQLRRAIETQEFERAAQLRDRIRVLRDGSTA